MSENPATRADDFFQGDHVPAECGSSASGEVELWCSVLEQVWRDAFILSLIALKTTDRQCSPELERAAARRWLVLDFGTDQLDRQMVCDMAGVCPDLINQAAKKRLEISKAGDAAEQKATAAAIDRAFTLLVARLDEMDRPEVTRTMARLAERESWLDTPAAN